MRLIVVALAIVVTAGCGGGAVPTGPRANPTYVAFRRLAKDLGGKMLNESDAAARASINCSAGGPALWRRSGMSVKDSPTDDALVRAYCPEQEPKLTGK